LVPFRHRGRGADGEGKSNKSKQLGRHWTVGWGVGDSLQLFRGFIPPSQSLPERRRDIAIGQVTKGRINHRGGGLPRSRESGLNLAHTALVDG